MPSLTARLKGTHGVVAAYAAFAALWILLSDQLLGWLVPDPALLVRYAMVKGWAFVAVTTALLFLLVRRLTASQEALHRQELDSALEAQRGYELLAAVAEHSEDLIFALDTSHRYQLINKAASDLVGLPQEQILNHGPRDLFPPEVAEAFIAIGDLVMTDGRPRRLEQVFPAPGGARTFMAIVGALHGPDHELIGTFGVARDMTERQRAEQALAASEERFRRLFEQAPVAMATSHRDGRIGEVNREFLAMLGYDRSEIGTIERWRQRVMPDEAARQAHVDAWQRQWNEPPGSSTPPIEQVLVCKDGTRRTVLLGRLNLGEDMLVSVVDITARKAAEQELRLRVEELERFNQASVGRELDMIELKRTINALSAELGRAPPHALDFLPADRRGGPR